MGAISSSNILTLLQTKHWKEQLFNILVALKEEYCKHWAQNMFTILSLLSTNLGKEQLFGKVVTTQASLSSLQAIHGKEQLFNILVALMEEYCKHWAQNMFTILALLSTNLGKEQLFGKVVITKVSLSSLQAIHGKEQLFNILHAIEDKVKYS
jgi:hypothetical protein